MTLFPASAGAAPLVEKNAVAKPPRSAAGISIGDLGGVSAQGVSTLDIEPNGEIWNDEPVGTGTYTGDMSDDTDSDDVYSIALNVGDELEVRLLHDWSTSGWGDVDVLLYPPGTEDFDASVVDMSVSYDINIEFVRYVVPPGGAGTYYIDLYALDTDGEVVGYDMDVSLNDAADISGVERYAGEDRYATALYTSYQTFADGSCTTAVLATGSNFPDALSASGLAGAMNGPLLLTGSSDLYYDIPWELNRLGVTDVIIVGGTSAVGSGVVSDLESEGYNVDRIAGDDRYETAALVADEVIAQWGAGYSGEAFVVRGDSFPDALAAAPFSYANGIPILLTPTTDLHSETESVIDAYNIQTVFVAGGIAAVSNGTQTQIEALNGGTVVTDRFAGSDRYATAAALAEGMVNGYGYNSFAVAGVATGANFPDALAGGAAMGYEGGVLLLTPGDVLDYGAGVTMWDNMSAGDDAVVFGGEAAIQTTGTMLEVWDLVYNLP